MEINKYITLLTFIPWICIYIVNILKHLSIPEYHTFTWKYFKKNIFKIFRIDILVLIIAFFFFSSFKKEFVNQYLFPVMCFTLWANSFYDKKMKRKKDFYQKNLVEIIILFLFMLIPFYIYFNKNNLALTYKIMLVYLFLDYFLILIASYIKKGFQKLKKVS